MRAENGWMATWTSGSTLLTVVAAAALLVAGCGGDRNVEVGNHGGGGGGGDEDGDHRYAQIDDLDLETGEAKQGLHLRPGIEILRVEYPSAHYSVDIDDEAMTVELTGHARDQALDIDEIWSDDILMGDDFIFLVVDVEDDGSLLTIHVETFELQHVIHGDWSIDMDPVVEGGSNFMEPDPNTELSLGLEELFGKAWEGAEISGSGSSSVSASVGGEIEFPMDWEGQFEGRISAAGQGINPDYECEPVERVKRRLWGGSRVVKEEPRYFCMEYLLVKGVVGIDKESHANFGAEGDVEIGADYTMKLPRALGPAPLGTPLLGIYLDPYLKFGTKVFLSAAGEIDVSAQAGLRLPLGFEYDHNDGLSFLPNEDHPVDVDDDSTIDPELKQDIEATLRLFGQAGMNIIISDTATGPRNGPKLEGPQVGGEVGKEFKGQSQPELCLKGTFYARGFVNPRLRASFKAWKIGVGIDILDPDERELRVNFAPYSFPAAPEGTDYEDMCDEIDVTPEDPTTLFNHLTWSEPTELDLVLTTPNGNTFRYDATNHDGGHYDPVQVTDPCTDDDSVCEEVIFWDESSEGSTAPPEGEYEVYVDNWQSGGQTANYDLEIRADGELLPVSYSGQVGAGEKSDPVTYTITH